MCKPSKPKAPPRLPEAPVMPTINMEDEARKRKAKAGAEQMGTLLTGPGGVQTPSTGGLTLLGGTTSA